MADVVNPINVERRARILEYMKKEDRWVETVDLMAVLFSIKLPDLEETRSLSPEDAEKNKTEYKRRKNIIFRTLSKLLRRDRIIFTGRGSKKRYATIKVAARRITVHAATL